MTAQRFTMVTAIQPGDVELGDFTDDCVISEDKTRATCTVINDNGRWTYLDGTYTGLPADVLDPEVFAELTDPEAYGLVSLTPVQD